ncbi:hypothetical protein [Leptolyngbya sp. PCC 6406]|uniref:hypothetical protein n=1 Tax=Leptolyngbya sp. PCC 6406 TaxID=1173264 RepID=UPI0002AC5B61|nr:hypothetical protein [Leptolyngbya sp. PCC 6406]
MKHWRRWLSITLGVALCWGWGLVVFGAVPQPPSATTPELETPAPLAAAFESANHAAELAQTARSTPEWNRVAQAWAGAIHHLHELPIDSPKQVFAQRQSRVYGQNLAIAQQQAERASRPRVFPSLGSQVLDDQLGVYLSYLATFGAPDILVVGSSRALQGIDPQVLQGALANQGVSPVRVYTFGVNGATAQMVSFLLRQVLTSEQLPRFILWADGSRAFNSGRVDRTFAAVLASPGYGVIQAGPRPTLGWTATPGMPAANPIPGSAINGYGFLPVTDIFNPNTYYQRFPRVSGQYDSTYQPFSLEGVQTLSLRAIATFAKSRNTPLVFVNLPLSNDYLDATRLQYERQFQQYLRQESTQGDFIVVDLLEQWRGQDRFFADPSHLNQTGAQQLSRQLATLRTIPWQSLQPPA